MEIKNEKKIWTPFAPNLGGVLVVPLAPLKFGT